MYVALYQACYVLFSKSIQGAIMKVQSRPCVHRVIAHRGAVVAPSFRISKPLRSAACNASSEKQATEPETGGARKLEDGRMTYNPSTFDEMISDAAAAVCRGLDSGLTRMEVEFPVVSGTDCALFSTSGSSNTVPINARPVR